MSSSSSTLYLLCASLLFTATLAAEEIPPVPDFNIIETEKWRSRRPNYSACLIGKMQSPIDINTKDVVYNKTMQPLTRNYHIYNATLSTDGYDAQVVFNGQGDLIIDSETYKLKQMHWHTPSEHRLNGVQYAAELHQVHTSANGNRAVVAILFKYGNSDRVLTMLNSQLDELAKEPCQDGREREVSIPRFNSSFLRKRPRKYYRYLGSLTTPPCDENVNWNVLTKVKTISKNQVEALKAPLCEASKIKNARPAQPLNGRKVQKYDGN